MIINRMLAVALGLSTLSFGLIAMAGDNNPGVATIAFPGAAPAAPGATPPAGAVALSTAPSANAAIGAQANGIPNGLLNALSNATSPNGTPTPTPITNASGTDISPQLRTALQNAGVNVPPVLDKKDMDMIMQGVKDLTPQQRALLGSAGIVLPPLPGAAAGGTTGAAAGAQPGENAATPPGLSIPAQPTPAQLAATQIPTQAAAPSTFGTVFDPAFQDMTKKQFPMTPEQIKALRQIFQATQRASVAPIETPTPTVSTQMVSLAPGSQPPVVKLATGFVTSVVFLDETGQPWPIADFSIGKPSAFTIQWDTNTNVLMIQGTGPYESGNMALRLANLPTPVMITLVSDQQKVDYRVDLRVQGRGPNAKASMISNAIPHSADTLLMDLLDGVPPLGSSRLSIVGGMGEAWLHADRLLLRTRLTVLSPEWSATMSSADGTKVYEMNPTPLILASQNGQTVTLKVEGL